MRFMNDKTGIKTLSNQEKEQEEKKEAPERSRQRGRDGMGF